MRYHRFESCLACGLVPERLYLIGRGHYCAECYPLAVEAHRDNRDEPRIVRPVSPGARHYVSDWDPLDMRDEDIPY